MSVLCPDSFSVLFKGDFYTGRPASAIRISAPVADNINHLQGNLLGGVRHVSIVADSIEAGTYHLKVHRHPNCDHIDVRSYFDGDNVGGTVSISVTAGTGSTATYTNKYATTSFRGMKTVRAPWGASNTGVQSVEVTYSNWSPKSFVVFDVPRASLGSGDQRVEFFDSTYPNVGIMERRYIADSSESGLNAMGTQIINAWKNNRRTLFSWANVSGEGRNVYGGDGYVDIFGGTPIKLKSRTKKSDDTYRTASVWIYSNVDDADGYHFAVTCNNTVSTGALSNAGASWQSEITGLQVPITDTSVTFEAMASGASGSSANIRSIFVIEDE